MATVIRLADRCFELWALGLCGVLYPVLYLAGGRLGETPAMFLSRDRDRSQLFMVCRGSFWGSGCVGWETRPAYLAGKTRGPANSHGEHFGRQVVPGNRHLGRVVLNTLC